MSIRQSNDIFKAVRMIGSVVACYAIYGFAIYGFASPSYVQAETGQHAVQFSGEAEPPTDPFTLWYRQPAKNWNEALPIGNGRLGAMVFGKVNHERLQLNEDTVWSGKSIDRNNPQGPQVILKARQLIFNDKHIEAEALIQSQFLNQALPKGVHSYQTLGDLSLLFPRSETVTNYRRELSLDRATVRVEYDVDDKHFVREYFSSPSDQTIVVRLTCNQPGQITFHSSLSRECEPELVSVSENELEMTGKARCLDKSHFALHPSAKEGVAYCVRLKVLAEGGQTTTNNQAIEVNQADSALLLLTASTDYRGESPEIASKVRLEQVCQKSYQNLLEDHLEEHRQLYRRMKIDLGGDEAATLPTDVRLNRVKNEKWFDPQLVSLYFQYGRYLLISSSRPGCMGANLQGIWADGYKPPWNSDYHININMQMNYWLAESCNLSECHTPFFDNLEALVPNGKRTARVMFDCDGFVAGHATDAWGMTEIFGKNRHGMWVTGPAWCTRQFWEHWLYTNDRDFLAKRAYPIMQEAARFFVDFLVENPKTGKLVSGPTTSPENNLQTPDGIKGSLSMGPAMDQQIIYELFSHCIEASEILDIDQDFRNDLKQLRSRLSNPIKFGTDGRILEWDKEYEESSKGHRHISHLYALYPSWQVSPGTTPEWAAAARKTIDYRLRHGGARTGWSRAWVINFFARLLDGNKCQENLQALFIKSTLPNLFDTHPPFQIDGNFGATAAIAEMLLQSHERNEAGEHVLVLLPALPDAWSDGSIIGMKARGGTKIDLEWHEGRLKSANLSSKNATSGRLRYANHEIAFKLAAGEEQTFTVSDFVSE